MEIALNQPWDWNGKQARRRRPISRSRPGRDRAASAASAAWPPRATAARRSRSRSWRAPSRRSTTSTPSRLLRHRAGRVAQRRPTRPQDWIDAADDWSSRCVNGQTGASGRSDAAQGEPELRPADRAAARQHGFGARSAARSSPRPSREPGHRRRTAAMLPRPRAQACTPAATVSEQRAPAAGTLPPADRHPGAGDRAVARGLAGPGGGQAAATSALTTASAARRGACENRPRVGIGPDPDPRRVARASGSRSCRRCAPSRASRSVASTGSSTSPSSNAVNSGLTDVGGPDPVRAALADRPHRRRPALGPRPQPRRGDAAPAVHRPRPSARVVSRHGRRRAAEPGLHRRSRSGAGRWSWPATTSTRWTTAPSSRRIGRRDAEVTCAVRTVPIDEAHRFGILELDADGRVIAFIEKPPKPTSNLVSMGVYVFSLAAPARRALSPDRVDFGRDVLPWMVDGRPAGLRLRVRAATGRTSGPWRATGAPTSTCSRTSPASS